MKTKFLLFLSTLLFGLMANAQTVDWIWAKQLVSGSIFMRNAKGVRRECVDRQGNIYMAGKTSAGGNYNIDSTAIAGRPGKMGMYIAKFDTDGNMLWYKTGYCTNNTEESPLSVYDIAVDNIGNLYVPYHYSDTLVFDGVTYTEPVGDYASPINLFGVSAANGTINFNKNLIPSVINGYYNAIKDIENVMTGVNSNNELVVVYPTDSLVIQKINASGTTIMRVAHHLDFSSYLKIKRLSVSGPDIVFTGYVQNAVLIADTLIETNNGKDVLFKFNSSGTLEWYRQALTGSPSNSRAFYGVYQEPNGDVYYTGGFSDSLRMTGAPQTYYMVGKTESNATEFYVGKYNADGSFGWYTQGWGEKSNWGNTITMGADNSLYVMGGLDRRLFTMGGDTLTEEPSSVSDPQLIMQMNKNNGDVLWMKRVNNIGGMQEPDPQLRQINMFLDDANNIYFGASTGFPGLPIDGFTINSFGCFFAKSGEKAIGGPVSIKKLERSQLNVYPNPTEGILNCNETVVSYKVINQLGQVVNEEKVCNKTSLDFSELTVGIYFIEIRTANESGVIKFIKH